VSEEGTGGTVGTLAEYTPELRVLAVAFYGVGDLLTTLVGLHGDRAVEFGISASARRRSSIGTASSRWSR
jgi:hypothetical protein